MQEKLIFGAKQKSFNIGDIIYLAKDKPMKLESGQEISNFPIAYKTYGELNSSKDNAILIFHGLTADQYATEPHPVTGKDGWWNHMIGPNKPIDINKFFIICPNLIGSCMGSFSAKSMKEDNEAYALNFPVVTISDMVDACKLLLDNLEIDNLYAAIGASMGGMCALDWLIKYSNITSHIFAIATSIEHSAQNIAFHEIGRQAIIADENFCEGNYIKEKKFPVKGLSIARMIAHMTYLSEKKLEDKFGRDLQNKEKITYGFNADFQIESYLRYKGMSFVDRFDPNSYLYITRAMDYFDLNEKITNTDLSQSDTSLFVVSFTSDWLFPTIASKKIVTSFSGKKGVDKISFLEIESDKGHDSFLLPNKEFEMSVKGYLENNYL